MSRLNSRLLINMRQNYIRVDMRILHSRPEKQTISNTLFMKHIFGILMILVVATGTHANNLVNCSNSEPRVEIATRVENNYLSIEVADELVGVNVTVSVFNSMGEIVLEETLGLGLNKINVQTLAKGEYVAVVRENDQYASKSAFVVS